MSAPTPIRYDALQRHCAALIRPGRPMHRVRVWVQEGADHPRDTASVDNLRAEIACLLTEVRRELVLAYKAVHKEVCESGNVEDTNLYGYTARVLVEAWQDWMHTLPLVLAFNQFENGVFPAEVREKWFTERFEQLRSMLR